MGLLVFFSKNGFNPILYFRRRESRKRDGDNTVDPFLKSQI